MHSALAFLHSGVRTVPTVQYRDLVESKTCPRRNLEVSMRGLGQIDAIESVTFKHEEGNERDKNGVERGNGGFYGVSY